MSQKMELEKVAFYLEDLLASLKSGTLCIQQGENLVTLHPGQFVDFEVEAASKKGKEKLSLELSWRNDKDDEKKDFKIMSEEPAEEEAVAD